MNVKSYKFAWSGKASSFLLLVSDRFRYALKKKEQGLLFLQMLAHTSHITFLFLFVTALVHRGRKMELMAQPSKMGCIGRSISGATRGLPLSAAIYSLFFWQISMPFKQNHSKTEGTTNFMTAQHFSTKFTKKYTSRNGIWKPCISFPFCQHHLCKLFKANICIMRAWRSFRVVLDSHRLQTWS